MYIFILFQENSEDQDDENDELQRKSFTFAKECEYVTMTGMEKICNLGQKFVVKKVSDKSKFFDEF